MIDIVWRCIIVILFQRNNGCFTLVFKMWGCNGLPCRGCLCNPAIRTQQLHNAVNLNASFIPCCLRFFTLASRVQQFKEVLHIIISLHRVCHSFKRLLNQTISSSELAMYNLSLIFAVSLGRLRTRPGDIMATPPHSFLASQLWVLHDCVLLLTMLFWQGSMTFTPTAMQWSRLDLALQAHASNTCGVSYSLRQLILGDLIGKRSEVNPNLSGPLRLRLQSRSRTRLRIAASIAFSFRTCFKGVWDTIAPLSRGWAPLSGLERGGWGLLPVRGCEIGRDRGLPIALVIAEEAL